MIRDSFKYFLVDLLNKSSTFFIIPILAKELSISDYGLFSLVLPVALGIVTLSNLGFDNTFARFSYSRDYDPTKLFHTFSSITTLCAVLVTLVTGFLFVYIGIYTISTAIGVGVIAIAVSLISYPRTFFIVNGAQKYFTFYTLVQLFFWFFGIILFWKLNKLNLQITIWLLVFSYITSGVAGYFCYNKMIKIFSNFQFDRLYIINTSTYRWPVYGTSVVSFLYQFVDKFLVLGLLNATSLGVYSLVITISSLIKSVGTSIQFSIQPGIYKYLETNNFQQIIKTKLQLLFISLPLYGIFLFVVYFLWDILLPIEYLTAINYLPFVSLAFLLDVFYMINLNIFTYYKESKTIMTLEVVFMLIQALVLIFAIKIFGLIGLAYTMPILNLLKLQTILVLIKIKFKLPVPYLQYFLYYVVLLMITLAFLSFIS
jgi:O-antigen/teichoic acid export membrane protein